MIKSSSNRLKVLLSAHEISPVVGSECASGWNIITRLGYYHDITLLYAESNQFDTNNYKNQIYDYIQKNGNIPGIEFFPVPQPLITKKIASINRRISSKKTSVGLSFLYFMGVKYWEKQVFRAVKKLLKDREYDLVHHFNHISFREPGFLWKINLPFVWGPTSGLSRIPFQYITDMPLNEIFYNTLRNFLNYTQFYLNRRIHLAIKKARLVYYVTSDDGHFFSKKNTYSENLLDMGAYEVIGDKVKYHNTNIISILWVGRLYHLKALDILLNAVGSSEILKKILEIKIIGDGPQKEYYQKLAISLTLSNIKWIGLISKDDVFKEMRNSDALVHTSIKEAASAVILESISAGLPVICHDSFGMKFAINETCGIKVPYISREKSVEGFRIALEKLCTEPSLIDTLSIGAVKRAKELSWDSMAAKIASDYISIINS